MRLIELCAGTAAVSLAAIGASRFPVSRIGSKAGYTGPILDALELKEPLTEVILVEKDPYVCKLLWALTSHDRYLRELMACRIEDLASRSARRVWQEASEGAEPHDYLLWMAGARGGIGGFKGKHKLRPNVDGFIPSRKSLAKRLRKFDPGTVHAVIENRDVSSVLPETYDPSSVYIDPPYVSRQGYAFCLSEPVETIAKRWAKAGHRVVVSEARPLDGAREHREITELRKGQSRRSLTTDHAEWLSIYY